jgi:hypothetical protein
MPGLWGKEIHDTLQEMVPAPGAPAPLHRGKFRSSFDFETLGPGSLRNIGN